MPIEALETGEPVWPSQTEIEMAEAQIAEAHAKANKYARRLPPLPKINRNLLLNRTLEALRPPTQQMLPLHMRKYRHIGKQEILREMFNQVNLIASEHAGKVFEKSKHHAKQSNHRKSAVARVLADAWVWPELWDTYKGMARKEDIHYRRGIDKRWDREVIYKGVDKAFLRMLEAGVSVNELFAITGEFMTNQVDAIKRAELKTHDGNLPKEGIEEDWVSGSAAARIYMQSIKPRLGTLVWKELLRNEEFEASVDHNVMFMLHLCLRKEIRRRKVRENVRAFKQREVSYEERQRWNAAQRGDVKELVLQKNVPFQIVLEAVKTQPHEKARHKAVNRFA